MNRRFRTFPSVFLALLLAYVLLLALNRELIRQGVDTGAAWTWPFWEFKKGDPREGLPFLPLYLLAAAVLVVRANRLRPAESWALGVAVVLSGNLLQGGMRAAFVSPFVESGIQYYHDALKVQNAWDWLRGFNGGQAGLLMHARTHPPFATLLHHLILRAGGSRIGLLSCAFIALALATIPLLYATCRRIGMVRPRAATIAGLLAITPAFNIYAAASLDGVIAMTSTIALLGIAQIRSGGRNGAAAVLVLGFLATNMLTFAGLYLVPAVLGIALYDARTGAGPRWRRPIAWVVAAGFLAFGLGLACGYNHLAALGTASRLENPDGFMLFAHPLRYFLGRLQDVGEIVVFLMVPLAAILSRGGTAQSAGGRRSAIVLAAAGSTGVALLFLTGAHRAGQTARGCLFLVPYLLLLLGSAEEVSLRRLLAATAAQTAGMQLLGRWFW